jgi:hypothetical protein
MDLFRDILLQAKKRVESWSGTLYFIYLPAGDVQDSRKERKEVLTYVKSLGLPIIDVLPAFKAQDEPVSLFALRGFGHYNEAGHRLVAEQVLKGIP